MWLVKCFTEAWISAIFSGRSADGSTERMLKMPSSHIWQNPLEPTLRFGWLFLTKLNNWSLETTIVVVSSAMVVVRRTEKPPKFDYDVTTFYDIAKWRHNIENRNNCRSDHATSHSVAVTSTVDLNERGNLDEHESRWKLAKIYFSIWKILWST